MRADSPTATLVPSTEPPDATAESGFCGLFRLGGASIAVPLSAMREVVILQNFIPLPVAVPDLLGAIDVRGLVVPIFDLGAHLGLTSADAQQGLTSADAQRGSTSADAQQGLATTDAQAAPVDGPILGAVVLVTDGRRVLGIVVDELHGVTRVPHDDLMPLSIQGMDLLVSHTFRQPESATVFSVLSIAHLLDMPGVLSTDLVNVQVASVAEQAARAARDEQRVTLTVLRCGDLTLAADVADVHTTMPPASPRRSILTSDLCLGVMAFGESDIAVLDPLMLLGLGKLPSAHHGPVVVVKVGAAFIALTVSELITIAQVRTSAILPAPGMALGRSELIAGVVPIESLGDVIVLDGRAIREDRELLALGSMNVRTELEEIPTAELAVQVQSRRLAQAGPAQLVYLAGRLISTPLDQVIEILSFPRELIDTHGPDYLLGICSHRDEIIPIVDLRLVLGRSETTKSGPGCVLLVAGEQASVGWLVDSLSGIDQLTWQDEKRSANTCELTALDRALQDSPLVKVGDNDQLMPALDLRQLSTLLTRSKTGPTWQSLDAFPSLGDPPARAAA